MPSPKIAVSGVVGENAVWCRVDFHCIFVFSGKFVLLRMRRPYKMTGIFYHGQQRGTFVVMVNFWFLYELVLASFAVGKDTFAGRCAIRLGGNSG